MQGRGLKITCSPELLHEGLFGQVLLYVFEILPFLQEKNIYPNWAIYASHYSGSHDGRVLPGVFDIAYQENAEPVEELPLAYLRQHHIKCLGNDWSSLSKLWNSYFKVPNPVKNAAEDIGDFSNILGIHFRGTDKQYAPLDSNPVSGPDFLLIIRDILKRNSQFKKAFVATDDNAIVSYLRDSLPIEIINLGEIAFHKASVSERQKTERANRALLDCYILSRCKYVLTTSSALPAFAKILNPDLEIYRVAASKMFADIPYFPVAYLPKYTSPSAEVTQVISRLMVGD